MQSILKLLDLRQKECFQIQNTINLQLKAILLRVRFVFKGMK